MPPSIKKNLASAVRLFFTDKSSFDRNEFIILHTAMFGESPTEEETTSFYKKFENDVVPFEDVETYFKTKFEFLEDTELHILEVFRSIDKDEKCYISVQDIVLAQQNIGLSFSAELLMECFSLITPEENVLDYFAFRRLYMENIQ